MNRKGIMAEYRRPILLLVDGLFIYLSYFLSLILRFSGSFDDGYFNLMLRNFESVIWIYVLIGVILLYAVGFIKKLTFDANIVELFYIVIAITIASCLQFILPYLFLNFPGYFLPRSVLVIAYFLQIVFICGIRLLWRIITDKNVKYALFKGVSRNISFSPPDITDREIHEVVNAMRSGWITTGPRTKEFERRIAEYVGVNKAVCLNSATASMELTLRILGIGPGDEVITSAYTYTASASVIYHVGAKIVLVDTAPDSFEMDYYKLAESITERTKVIIPVNIGGRMCDYDSLYRAIMSKKDLYTPKNEIQKLFHRCIILADSAHGFGAVYKGKKNGQVTDFTCFSFHAVKNLTTGEGGAVVWRNDNGLDDEWLYNQYMLYSLHGQSKDALAKTQKGAWEYDIIFPAYKCNMTDILAGFGLMQLSRYDSLLKRRKHIIEMYDRELLPLGITRLEHYGDDFASTGHLYLVRIPEIDEDIRNKIITQMSELGISVNVHYKPLPMHTAYKNLGFDISNYPNAFNMYRNEITLPLHTMLTDDDVNYVCKNFKKVLNAVFKKRQTVAELETVNV